MNQCISIMTQIIIIMIFLSNSSKTTIFLEDDFNKKNAHKKINDDNFSIAHLNIRSIPANLSHFLGYMKSIKNTFTIYGFAQTWLSNDNLSAYVIDGYAHVGQPRVGKRGGGVSLFIRNNLAYSESSNLSETTEDIECLFIKLNHGGKNIIVGVVYRPPNSNVESFNAVILSKLESISNTPSYIMGEFNLDILKNKSHHQTGIFLIICTLMLSFPSLINLQG